MPKVKLRGFVLQSILPGISKNLSQVFGSPYFLMVTWVENEVFRSFLQSILPKNITISVRMYKILLVAPNRTNYAPLFPSFSFKFFQPII
jgi:hypothetical protein